MRHVFVWLEWRRPTKKRTKGNVDQAAKRGMKNSSAAPLLTDPLLHPLLLHTTKAPPPAHMHACMHIHTRTHVQLPLVSNDEGESEREGGGLEEKRTSH